MNTAFYTISPQLHDVLCEEGYGYIVDAIPFTFTRKGGFHNELLARVLGHVEAGGALQVSRLPGRALGDRRALSSAQQRLAAYEPAALAHLNTIPLKPILPHAARWGAAPLRCTPPLGGGAAQVLHVRGKAPEGWRHATLDG